MGDNAHYLAPMLSAINRIKTDLMACHPKTLLLFGSLARHLTGDAGDHLPNDVDLLVVTNNTPFLVMKTDYGFPVELHTFTVDRMVG